MLPNGVTQLTCWSVVSVVVHVEIEMSPKMKSFSSAVKDDEERECAHTSLKVRHSPDPTRPDAVRSTPISVKVNGCVALPLLIDPNALSGFALMSAAVLGRRPQQGSTLALKQVLAKGEGVLPVPVDLSIQT